MRYLARWHQYGVGRQWKHFYYEFEADNQKTANLMVVKRQCENGITPGDYDLFLMLVPDEVE